MERMLVGFEIRTTYEIWENICHVGLWEILWEHVQGVQ